MFVVFDLDGTLIDGYDGITDALGYAMERLGREPLLLEDVRRMVGEGLERLIEKALGPDYVSDGVRLFRRRYAQIVDEKTRLMPGVPEVLARLAAAGCSMGVASNKPADFSRRILTVKGIVDRFVGIAGPGADIPAKPHPEMLQRLMREAGAEPGQTAVVGDMEIDAEFARAAGCRAVLVAGGSRLEDELARVAADVHLSRISELPDWIDRMSRKFAPDQPRIGR